MILASEVRRVFDYDAGEGVLVRKVVTGSRAVLGPVGCLHKTLGYVMVGLHGKRYYAHRLIWLHAHGAWPAGQIDHINHDRADNRLANLRVVTDAQNKQNKPKQRNNTSGHVGVWWHAQRGKWAAEIKVGRKKRHLGTFDSLADAVEVRRVARVALHPHGFPQP